MGISLDLMVIFANNILRYCGWLRNPALVGRWETSHGNPIAIPWNSPINIPIDSLIMYHHDNPVVAILNYYLSGR